MQLIHSFLRKFISSTFLCLIIGANAFAQSNNFILFSENGEKFQLALNGIIQNPEPETNVKLTKLPAPEYKCRAIFSDSDLGYVDFNLIFPEAGEELSMSLKQNNKGEYVSRYVSSIPVASAPPSPKDQSIYTYRSKAETKHAVSSGFSQTSSTQSSSGMNAIDSEGGVYIDISELDEELQAGSVTTRTTTSTRIVTRTTTTGSESSGEKNSNVDGYAGRTACLAPISSADFIALKQNIASKDFESSKLSIAKQSVENSCLTSDQVYDLLTLFSFENTRLELAKFAYAFTYDPGNYFKVNNAFEFESSGEELNLFINSRL